MAIPLSRGRNGFDSRMHRIEYRPPEGTVRVALLADRPDRISFGPIVYWLGLQTFNLHKRVRFSLGSQSSSEDWYRTCLGRRVSQVQILSTLLVLSNKTENCSQCLLGGSGDCTGLKNRGGRIDTDRGHFT